MMNYKGTKSFHFTSIQTISNACNTPLGWAQQCYRWVHLLHSLYWESFLFPAFRWAHSDISHNCVWGSRSRGKGHIWHHQGRRVCRTFVATHPHPDRVEAAAHPMAAFVSSAECSSLRWGEEVRLVLFSPQFRYISGKIMLNLVGWHLDDILSGFQGPLKGVKLLKIEDCELNLCIILKWNWTVHFTFVF